MSTGSMFCRQVLCKHIMDERIIVASGSRRDEKAPPFRHKRHDVFRIDCGAFGAIPRKYATARKTCDRPVHEGCYNGNIFKGRIVFLVHRAQQMATASVQRGPAAKKNVVNVVECCPALQTSARTRITPSARASKKEFGCTFHVG